MNTFYEINKKVVYKSSKYIQIPNASPGIIGYNMVKKTMNDMQTIMPCKNLYNALPLACSWSQ